MKKQIMNLEKYWQHTEDKQSQYLLFIYLYVIYYILYIFYIYVKETNKKETEKKSNKSLEECKWLIKKKVTRLTSN